MGFHPFFPFVNYRMRVVFKNFTKCSTGKYYYQIPLHAGVGSSVIVIETFSAGLNILRKVSLPTNIVINYSPLSISFLNI